MAPNGWFGRESGPLHRSKYLRIHTSNSPSASAPLMTRHSLPYKPFLSVIIRIPIIEKAKLGEFSAGSKVIFKGDECSVDLHWNLIQVSHSAIIHEICANASSDNAAARSTLPISAPMISDIRSTSGWLLRAPPVDSRSNACYWLIASPWVT